MKTINAIAKLQNAGFTLTNNGNRYEAVAKNHVISFLNQDDSINCINVRGENEHDDVTTDYSAGVFCDNLKQAIALVR